jgi:ligand-binding sensor domain-containing protein
VSLGLTLGRSKGLPSNQVHGLSQDVKGRLWLAGPAGLSCYDGSRVVAFDRRNGLRCAGLRTVKATSDGAIWIGTDLGLEALNPFGQAIDLGVADAWVFGLVQCIVPFESSLWLGTAQGLVQFNKTNADTQLQMVSAEDVGFVRDIVAGPRGILALSSKRGLIESKASGSICRNAVLPTGEQLTRLACRQSPRFVCCFG